MGDRENPSRKSSPVRGRGNLVRQGILEGELAGNGPRLCVESTWRHPIKSAHFTDFLIQSHCRGQQAVLPSSASPDPARRYHMGCPMFPREEAQRRRQLLPCSHPLAVFSRQGLELQQNGPEVSSLTQTGLLQALPDQPEAAQSLKGSKGKAGRWEGAKGRKEAFEGIMRESPCVLGVARLLETGQHDEFCDGHHPPADYVLSHGCC